MPFSFSNIPDDPPSNEDDGPSPESTPRPHSPTPSVTPSLPTYSQINLPLPPPDTPPPRQHSTREQTREPRRGLLRFRGRRRAPLIAPSIAESTVSTTSLPTYDNIEEAPPTYYDPAHGTLPFWAMPPIREQEVESRTFNPVNMSPEQLSSVPLFALPASQQVVHNPTLLPVPALHQDAANGSGEISSSRLQTAQEHFDQHVPPSSWIRDIYGAFGAPPPTLPHSSTLQICNPQPQTQALNPHAQIFTPYSRAQTQQFTLQAWPYVPPFQPQPQTIVEGQGMQASVTRLEYVAMLAQMGISSVSWHPGMPHPWMQNQYQGHGGQGSRR